MGTIVALIIGAVICYIIYLILKWIPLPAPFKNIILIIFGLIVFLWLLDVLGVYNSNFGINFNK